MAEKLKADFFDRLQFITEKYLTYHKRTKRIKKEKQKAKNIVLDWIEAFLWAAGMVLLINQYLLQAYVIPSGSMIDTLLIGDRIFVNKIIYGPELLPGVGKLPSPVKPKRNEVIIFENPAYISRGLAFGIAQRVIYMLTLSLVDIDRDEFGQPKAQFLIKRAVGAGGDWFIQDRGYMRLRPAGDSRWIDENEFITLQGMAHNVSRLMRESEYPVLEAAGKAAAFRDLGLPLPASVQHLAPRAASILYPDRIAHEKARLEILRGAFPHESRYSVLLARHNQGIFIPMDRILPLGDNRDNSMDGRSYGPVRKSKILGRASIIYWPGNLTSMYSEAIPRFGFIR
jgi:signal peptidase I